MAVKARRSVALAISLAMVVAACDAPSGSPVGSAGTGSPGASAVPTFVASPTSAVPASFPAASLDASMSADDLFAEDAVAADLGLVELGREANGGAIVRDVRFAGSRGEALAAWIIEPTSAEPAAGVLFLHWLGGFNSNRDEFLDEAVALADDGVASLLLDQAFPWTEQASGLEHDRVEIGFQVRDTWRAMSILADEVGDAPLAVVGHDFGGMYAAILRGLEPRLSAVVVMASTGAWADWFVEFVHVVPESEAPAYAAGLEDVDPIAWIAKPAGTPVLFQFSRFDPFISTSRADAFVAAVGKDGEARRYDAGHELDEAARSDRDAWLLERLGN